MAGLNASFAVEHPDLSRLSRDEVGEADESLKERLLNKVKSENLIADSARFKNASNFSVPIQPFNSKPTPNLKPAGSMTTTFRFMLLVPIRFHQKVITHQDGPLCTFRPTCSQYGYEAIKRYGLRGLLMTSDRLLRCYRGNLKYYPAIGQFAYDPVP
jgi:putative component of membrane protein insertase Oxa1/YidC/SpoIIIJ protein YidD